MTDELTIYRENESAPISPFGSIAGFETAQRMAKALATSNFTPKEFRNNVGDCLIVLETAARTGMPIMALLQNTYVIHGKPSFSSSFMAGLINGSGRFDEPLSFVYNEDRTSCYAVATKNGKEYRGVTITMEMAQKEGWLSKKGSKWQTMPELMLQYRATSFFARAYCADIIMGMRSVDEIMDTTEYPRDPADVHHTDNITVDLNDRFSEDAKTEPPAEEPAPKHEPEEKKPAARPRPAVVKKFKAEIDAIENHVHLDRWRQKHYKRICRELPASSDQSEIMAYAEERYQHLSAPQDAPPAPNDPPADQQDNSAMRMVNCPDKGYEVSTWYCETNCQARQGCPVFDDDDAGSSKLTMEV